jgi:hypothetical protein
MLIVLQDLLAQEKQLSPEQYAENWKNLHILCIVLKCNVNA